MSPLPINPSAGEHTLTLVRDAPAEAVTTLRVLDALELRQESDDILLELIAAVGPLDPLHLCRMIKRGWLADNPVFGECLVTGLALFVYVPDGALRISLLTNDIGGVLFTKDNAVEAFVEPFMAATFLGMLAPLRGAARSLHGLKILTSLARVITKCKHEDTRIETNDKLVREVKYLIDGM